MTSILVALIGLIQAFITTIGFYFLRKYFRQKTKPHSISKAIKQHEELEEKMLQIKHYLSAQRISVFKFHNGGHFYTGDPIQKLSMIAEKHAEDLDSIISDYQAIPIHLFQRKLVNLTDAEYFVEDNELKYDDALATMNKSSETTAGAWFKIISKEGYLIGVLSIGFTHHKTINQDEINYVLFQLNGIREIVTSYKE